MPCRDCGRRQVSRGHSSSLSESGEPLHFSSVIASVLLVTCACRRSTRSPTPASVAAIPASRSPLIVSLLLLFSTIFVNLATSLRSGSSSEKAYQREPAKNPVPSEITIPTMIANAVAGSLTLARNPLTSLSLEASESSVLEPFISTVHRNRVTVLGDPFRILLRLVSEASRTRPPVRLLVFCVGIPIPIPIPGTSR